MKVLGVDASLRGTGLGVVEQQGSRTVSRHWEVVKISAKAPHSECLRRIRERTEAVLAEQAPAAAAVEGGLEPLCYASQAAFLSRSRASIPAPSRSASRARSSASSNLVPASLT